MLVAGFDALAIMHAGGWKLANQVLRYVENASTKELHDRRWKTIVSGMSLVRNWGTAFAAQPAAEFDLATKVLAFEKAAISIAADVSRAILRRQRRGQQLPR